MKRPIGIFDSGVGGLTVASAIKKRLPNESFIYFGDTLHTPYGDKSKTSIRQYSRQITQFLLSQNCKAIVIACNTASALAYKKLCKEFSHIPILNVIDPVVGGSGFDSQQKVGIIATRATVDSEIYRKRLQDRNPDLDIVSEATPLFVTLVEEGFINTPLSREAIKEYLGRKKFENLDSLILGCTHFPLLQKEIEEFFEHKVQIIDSPSVVAANLEEVLRNYQIQDTGTEPGSYLFFVSEITRAFSNVAKRFFGEDILLKEKSL